MFNVLQGNVFETDQECVIVGLFDRPEKFAGKLTSLDELFAGELSELVKSGDISAKRKEVSLIHGLGKSRVKRLLFVGLGKEKELNYSELKLVLGTVSKKLTSMRIESFAVMLDRKSTRLNSSHVKISYAV